MKTLDQELMQHAYNQVSMRAGSNDDAAKKRYALWCTKLAGMIAISGLAQAIMFLDAKKKDEKAELGFKWLLEDLAGVKGVKGDIVEVTRECGVGEYMFLTRRIQQALVFFKRFSESLIGDEEDNP